MKQNKWIEKGVWGLLIVLNALFLYYWIVLAANYCFHYDDAFFAWKMKEVSIFDYVREMYLTRGGNFISYGLNGLLFKLSYYGGSYRIWSMLFYLLGIVMTWGAFNAFSWIKNSGWKGCVVVVTLYNVYVLTSVDYAVFTWMCAMEYFLFAPALCMLLKYLVKDTLKWWQWILLIVLAIFIAGNSVSISTVTLVVLFVYGMYIWHREKWNVLKTWTDPHVKRLVGIAVLMLICFAIVYVAPGNKCRMESEFDIEQPHSIAEFVKAIITCAGMFMYMMAFYLPYHLIAVAMGACAGIKYPSELSLSLKNVLLWTIVIAFTYIIISVAPLAYLSNGFAIQRNYIQIGYFYIFTFFALGYLLTNKAKIDSIKLSNFCNVSVCVCAFFLIVIMGVNIQKDLPVARVYNKAHQEREAYLVSLQNAGQKETITVRPFPTTQMPDAKYYVLKMLGKTTSKQAIYYESDTEEEPNEYEGHIKKLLKLDFDFVIAPKE